MKKSKILTIICFIFFLVFFLGCESKRIDSVEIKSRNNIKTYLSIIGYDGIPLGADFKDIPKYLDKIKGIQRTSNNKPFFQKVPTKTYYWYFADRKINDKVANSEISLFFKNNKLIQIKEVFGGNYRTIEEGMPWFDFIADQLKLKWQEPDYSEDKRQITWSRNDVTAVLTIRQEPKGLPVIKLLVWKS